MIAIPLIFGRLTAADYEDAVVADPRIDALRAGSPASRIRGSPRIIMIPKGGRSPTRCASN